MCVCMCVYVCVYVCMYVYVCVCIHAYVCMHNILGGIVRGKCPTQNGRGNCPGGNCPGGNCPGGIVQGELSYTPVNYVTTNRTKIQYNDVGLRKYCRCHEIESPRTSVSGEYSISVPIYPPTTS